MSDRIRRPTRVAAVVAVVVVLLALPLYVEEFWLRLGFAICGAAVGALGLNVLTGVAGQLSLAHAFFLAVGAVSYCALAGDPDPAVGPRGLGWPTLLAVVGAVALSALAGLVISPLSSRLSGLNLGVATLGLVFVGQYVLATAHGVTGGFEGRSTPPLEIAGLSFSDVGELTVLGVPFGAFERLWYVGFALLGLSIWLVRNLLRSRHGRAFQMVRDKPLQAGVSGVDIRRSKRQAFVVSSALAGLSGVMFALLVGSIAPLSFTLEVSVQYLVMIVVGGMGTVSGAVVGAAFVTALPILLQRYTGALPLVGETISPAALARYVYGAAVVLVLIVQPGGVVGLARALARPFTRRPTVDPTPPSHAPPRKVSPR